MAWHGCSMPWLSEHHDAVCIWVRSSDLQSLMVLNTSTGPIEKRTSRYSPYSWSMCVLCNQRQAS